MAKKETTPKDRKDYILQQREDSKKYGRGPSKRVLGDMSFIDRAGNIIRPNKKEYNASMTKKRDYPQEQAIKLNQEYDALISKHGKNSKEVYNFRRKALGADLGMYQYKRKGIEGTLGIIGLAAGIFFLSPVLTGNVIANLTNQTSNIIGGGLFVIGIIGSFMWFKKR